MFRPRYEHARPGKTQDVREFARDFVSKGMTSVWGDNPNPREHTTFNARTYVGQRFDVGGEDVVFFPNSFFPLFRRARGGRGASVSGISLFLGL